MALGNLLHGMIKLLGTSLNRGSGDLDPEEFEQVSDLVGRERALRVQQRGRQNIPLLLIQVPERCSCSLVEFFSARFTFIVVPIAPAKSNFPRIRLADGASRVNPHRLWVL